jgi:hypothetical protein
MEFNHDYWVAVAAAAPALLIAFAATFEQLLSRNRETAPYRLRFDVRWANAWMNGVPYLGGLLTVFGVVMLAVRRESSVAEWVAGIALTALLYGVGSSVVTLNSLRKRFPPDGAWECEGPTRSRRREQWKEQRTLEVERIRRLHDRRPTGLRSRSAMVSGSGQYAAPIRTHPVITARRARRR